MSAFKASNIEYDEESDVEIDDTKEIQIEEALKLYQNALRYHAEGPASFEQAAAAYKELFSSDVFKYPESQNELQRIELYGPIVEDDLWLDGPGQPQTGLDAGPSTLPQILHLSHKNYAHFKLELLSYQLETLHATLTHVLSDASQALDHFVSALDKDDSDTDLWKKTAQVGRLLDSKRITRFCLEAVLDNDEEGLGLMLSLPGVEDGIAARQLSELTRSIDDHLSAYQQPPQAQRRVLSKFLKQRLDMFESLTDRVSELRVTDNAPHTAQLKPQVYQCPNTWTALGELILRSKSSEPTSVAAVTPIIRFELPTQNVDEQTMLEMDDDDDTVVADTQVTASFETADESRKDSTASSVDNARPLSQRSTESPVAERRTSVVSEQGSGRRVSLPSRKRTNDAIADGDDGKRSKRVRARDSIMGPADTKQALHDENIQWEFNQHLKEVQQIDDWVSDAADTILSKLEISSLAKIKSVKTELERHASDSDFTLARNTFSDFLHHYSDSTAQALLLSSSSPDFTFAKGKGDAESTRDQKIPNGGHSGVRLENEGLLEFLQDINANDQTLENVAAEFIEKMTCPGAIKHLDSKTTSYVADTWSEQLKSVIVRLMVTFDDTIFRRASTAVEAHRARQPDETLGNDQEDAAVFTNLRTHMQAVLELHLDVYCLIKKANSGVDPTTVVLQGYRLERWFELTREANYIWAQDHHHTKDEALEARFLWTTTFLIIALDDAAQDTVLKYMQDGREHLERDNVSVDLANNAVMPQVSAAALDREISKLTTKDFFERLSDMEQSDPVALIEAIEPLLVALEGTSDPDSEPPSELIAFLQTKSFAEILKMWTRLLQAYEQIDYTPMVVRTQLRIMRLLLDQLQDARFSEIPAADQPTLCLKTLRAIGDAITDVLGYVTAGEDALSCLVDKDLRDNITALGDVMCLLQVFNVFEDPIRIGKTQAPTTSSGATCPSYKRFRTYVHEMQLRSWVLLYHLLKDAINQNQDLFTTPLQDRFALLSAVHRSVGIRTFCGGLNAVFIRLLKDEFFTMTHCENYESEQAQVLYDLHGVNCFLNPQYELMDHQCQHQAFIDRTTAQHAVDLLLIQAKRLPIKDLVKHTLKDAIEKVHGAVVRKKPTEAVLRNRDVIREHLRSPINPLDIYKALQGEGGLLPTLHVPQSDALLAAKGWYFLMGYMSLTKFRSTKRTAATPTEDVDIAIAFFMQDLEYSTTSWETWFRLAQAYETKIEESIVWSAEKLNNNMDELNMLQKASVHCFTIATALMYRSAEVTFETTDKISELCADFAARMYSSSRAPFSCHAFDMEMDKHASRRNGMVKVYKFKPLGFWQCFKLAKVLYQRAIAGNPNSWMLWYQYAKVLYRMVTTAEQHAEGKPAPQPQEVFDALYRSVELLPSKKETRESKREPILEPHYKLISVAHKFYIHNRISKETAIEVLDRSPYRGTAPAPEERNEWNRWISGIVRNIRAADKSNWHHRMVARTVALIESDYSRQPDPIQRSLDMKNEFMPQMFTKTMVLQVWRPEAERPGRHFVYTYRYTDKFLHVLKQLKDFAGLEALARRVRRRQHEIWQHSKLWSNIIESYLELLREKSGLREGLETSTFSNIGHEDFVLRKEPLERWMQSQDNGTDVVLDVLREVTELKKINQALMKTGPIDDLIGDCYAHLYNTVGKRLEDEQRLADALAQANAPPPVVVEPPPANVMKIMSVLSMDGASDVAVKVEPSPEPDAAPAKRRLGIGRREIRAAAEVCASKGSGAAHGSRASLTHEKARVAVVANAEPALEVPALDSSAPGSVNNDADDESELSELEEIEDEPLVVPAANVPVVKSGFAAIDAQEPIEAKVEPESSDTMDVELPVSDGVNTTSA